MNKQERNLKITDKWEVSKARIDFYWYKKAETPFTEIANYYEIKDGWIASDVFDDVGTYLVRQMIVKGKSFVEVKKC